MNTSLAKPTKPTENGDFAKTHDPLQHLSWAWEMTCFPRRHLLVSSVTNEWGTLIAFEQRVCPKAKVVQGNRLFPSRLTGSR